MIKVVLKSFIFLIVTLLEAHSYASHTNDFAHYLKEQLMPHRREVKRVGRKIIKASKGANVVVIGRSPTLFSAYLELSGVKVYYLPLTSGQTLRHLNEAELKRFEEYVLSRVPNSEGIPILFLDFINTGKSIRVLNGVLRDMHNRVLIQDFSYMFLTSSFFDFKFRSQLRADLEAPSFRFIKISKELEGRLLSHAFDYYAPYFSYRPLDHFKEGLKPQKNPMYEVFKQVLLKISEPPNDPYLEPSLCQSFF